MNISSKKIVKTISTNPISQIDDIILLDDERNFIYTTNTNNSTGNGSNDQLEFNIRDIDMNIIDTKTFSVDDYVWGKRFINYQFGGNNKDKIMVPLTIKDNISGIGDVFGLGLFNIDFNNFQNSTIDWINVSANNPFNTVFTAIYYDDIENIYYWGEGLFQDQEDLHYYKTNFISGSHSIEYNTQEGIHIGNSWYNPLNKNVYIGAQINSSTGNFRTFNYDTLTYSHISSNNFVLRNTDFLDIDETNEILYSTYDVGSNLYVTNYDFDLNIISSYISESASYSTGRLPKYYYINDKKIIYSLRNSGQNFDKLVVTQNETSDNVIVNGDLIFTTIEDISLAQTSRPSLIDEERGFIYDFQLENSSGSLNDTLNLYRYDLNMNLIDSVTFPEDQYKVGNRFTFPSFGNSNKDNIMMPLRISASFSGTGITASSLGLINLDFDNIANSTIDWVLSSYNTNNLMTTFYYDEDTQEYYYSTGLFGGAGATLSYRIVDFNDGSLLVDYDTQDNFHNTPGIFDNINKEVYVATSEVGNNGSFRIFNYDTLTYSHISSNLFERRSAIFSEITKDVVKYTYYSSVDDYLYYVIADYDLNTLKRYRSDMTLTGGGFLYALTEVNTGSEVFYVPYGASRQDVRKIVLKENTEKTNAITQTFLNQGYYLGTASALVLPNHAPGSDVDKLTVNFWIDRYTLQQFILRNFTGTSGGNRGWFFSWINPGADENRVFSGIRDGVSNNGNLFDYLPSEGKMMFTIVFDGTLGTNADRHKIYHNATLSAFQDTTGNIPSSIDTLENYFEIVVGGNNTQYVGVTEVAIKEGHAATPEELSQIYADGVGNAFSSVIKDPEYYWQLNNSFINIGTVENADLVVGTASDSFFNKFPIESPIDFP